MNFRHVLIGCTFHAADLFGLEELPILVRVRYRTGLEKTKAQRTEKW